TGPSLFQPAIAGLQSAGLTGAKARIGLEKPLGHDLASFHSINDAVLTAFPEERTFRIDHYLGKETVQNLLALRFGNRLFEQLWNATGIEHIQITVAETVGLEGRGGFYDEAGALGDMVQNHMLQLLSLVAMEPPAHFNAAEVRDEKVKVLRSLRPIDRTTAETHSVIGQYGAGVVRGAPVPGYVEELGKPSGTETFVALKAYIDNWRWKGVPFYLRPGKRLGNRQPEASPHRRQALCETAVRSLHPAAASAALDLRERRRVGEAEQAHHSPATRGEYSPVGDGQGAWPRSRRHSVARSAARPVANQCFCRRAAAHRL